MSLSMWTLRLGGGVTCSRSQESSWNYIGRSSSESQMVPLLFHGTRVYDERGLVFTYISKRVLLSSLVLLGEVIKQHSPFPKPLCSCHYCGKQGPAHEKAWTELRKRWLSRCWLWLPWPTPTTLRTGAVGSSAVPVGTAVAAVGAHCFCQGSGGSGRIGHSRGGPSRLALCPQRSQPGTRSISPAKDRGSTYTTEDMFSLLKATPRGFGSQHGDLTGAGGPGPFLISTKGVTGPGESEENRGRLC